MSPPFGRWRPGAGAAPSRGFVGRKDRRGPAGGKGPARAPEGCMRVIQITLWCREIHDLDPWLDPVIRVTPGDDRLETCRRSTTWPWPQRLVRPWHSTCEKWCAKDPEPSGKPGDGTR